MAQTVLSDSFVGYPEELAIFEKPLQNIGIKRTHTSTYYPINDYSNQGVIQFSVPNNSGSYIDLNATRLNITCKIVGRNGEAIKPPKLPSPLALKTSTQTTAANNSDGKTKSGENPAATEAAAEDAAAATTANEPISLRDVDKSITEAIVAPVNNFMHSMFERVDVSLQNKVLTHSDQSYPYLAYLKALLYTSEEMKQSTLRMAMFYKDTSSELNDANWVLGENKGLTTRGSYFNNSNQVDLTGRLYSDILEISRFIPGGVPLNITLYPSSPDFCLLAPDDNGGNYKIIITKASLEVTMLDLDPLISVAHAELLKTKNAIFPYIKTEVKKYTLGKGVYSGEINDPFSGRIPAEMVIGLVSDQANHGAIRSNPYFFEHKSLNYIQVTVDGQDLSQGPIQPKYSDNKDKNGLYMDAYKTLCDINGDHVMPVTREEYPNGYCLYRFVTEQTNGANDDLIPLKRTGNMRISVKFDHALPSPTTMIVFGKFPAALKIDNNRAVYEV